MLGNSALAQTPFATLGGGVVFTRYVQEVGTGSDVLVAAATFSSNTLSAGTITDSCLVGPSVFGTSLAEAGQVADTSSAVAAFSTVVTGVSSALALATVDPSIFNADVSASATGEALVLANATFIASASAGVLGVDIIMARLLWEVINDSQNASWQNINSAETAGWSVIGDAQTTTWSVVKTQS